METPNPTPAKTPRFLPSTIYGWIAVGLLIALLVIFFSQWRPFRKPDPRPIQELSHLRLIGLATLAYATDHDGLLPEHISRLQDPEHEYIPADYDMDWVESPFLPNAEMSEDVVDSEPPTDWYMHGHYHFFPTAGLNVNDIESPTDFVLAYGSMQGDPPQHAAVFLDGTTRWVSLDELRELKARQHGLIARE